jgi:hypothetical protein
MMHGISLDVSSGTPPPKVYHCSRAAARSQGGGHPDKDKKGEKMVNYPNIHHYL